MFAKLLKYDFRSTWGLIGGMSIIALAAGALGSVLVRALEKADGFMLALLVIAMVATVIYMVGYALAAMFILLSRFYRSRFTDEGYMTFTLPVTTHQILLSSFVNCALGMLVSILVTIIAFAIMLFFGTVDLDGQRWEFVKFCFDHLPRLVNELGVGNILSFLVLVLVGLVCETISIMLAITIGSIIAKKHKILVGVVAYYALHIILTVATVAFAIYLGDTWSESTFLGYVWCNVAWSAVVSVGFYFVMHWLTNRKLNLN